MALDKHDIQAIGDLLDDRLGKQTTEVCEFIDSAINPQLQEIRDDLGVVKKDVGQLAGDVGEIATHLRLIEDSFAMPKEQRLKLSRSRL
jgi:hypothetical protein